MFKKAIKFKNIWPYLAFLVLSWWAIRPLFHSGFFPMHDDEQIARLYELHQALSTGQFPPRWVSNLGFGFGYPLYNFYPPFVYYLGEVFHLLGFSLIASTKIVMILGFLLSGFFMYLLGKEFFGKVAGLVSAIFYLYAPYHALDLYVRGALAEFYSFVFLPAVFWSTSRLVKEKSIKWLIINGLFLSFLLLSHNLIALIFLPFYFIFLVFLIFFEKQKKQAFLVLLFSFFLFLGLTAYFWVPALFEKRYTLVDEILTRELASYKLHFVYLRQFWHSPWGYGGSIFGLEDGISFEIGKPHLILSFLAGVLGLFFLWRRNKSGLLFTFSFFPEAKKLAIMSLIAFFLLFTFSLFMASFHSQFIWDKIRPLWYLQFPWRFLVFIALFSSLLSGAVIGYFLKYVKKKAVLKWGVILIIFVSTIYASKDYFKPARYFDVTDPDYITEDELKWRVSKMSFEYVPKGVATKLSDIQTTQLDLEKDEIARASFEIMRGPLEIVEIKNLPHKKIYKTKGEGRLRINIYNFPGWKAFSDGEEIEIKETGKLKLITLNMSKGEHRVEVVFTDTPVRKFANLVSLATVIIILTGGFYVKRAIS